MERDKYIIEVYLPGVKKGSTSCSLNCGHCPLGIDRAGNLITDFNEEQLRLLESVGRHIAETKGEIEVLLFPNSLLTPELKPTAIPISMPPNEFLFGFGEMRAGGLGNRPNQEIAAAIHERSLNLLTNIEPRSTMFSIGFRPPDIQKLEDLLRWDWAGMSEVSALTAKLILEDPNTPFKENSFSFVQNLNGVNPRVFHAIRDRMPELYLTQRKIFDITRRSWLTAEFDTQSPIKNLYDDEARIEAHDSFTTNSGVRVHRAFRLVRTQNRLTPSTALKVAPEFAFAVLGDQVWVNHGSYNITDQSLRFSFREFQDSMKVAREEGKALRDVIIEEIKQRRT